MEWSAYMRVGGAPYQVGILFDIFILIKLNLNLTSLVFFSYKIQIFKN